MKNINVGGKITMQAGVCVYSVLEDASNDYLGMFRAIANMGCKNIELLGGDYLRGGRFSDRFSAHQVRDVVDELGMCVTGTHEKVEPGVDIVDHDWDRLMDYYETVGCRNIMLPSIWVADREETLRLVDSINKVGRRMKKRGFQFYLHTHSTEFRRQPDGSTLMDLILAETSPETMMVELDMVWAMRGGMDVCEMLNKLGARCDMVHQKDLSKDFKGPVSIFEAARLAGDPDCDPKKAPAKYTRREDFAEVGTGVFDYDTVYQKLRKDGFVRYTIIENDARMETKLPTTRRELAFIEKYL